MIEMQTGYEMQCNGKLTCGLENVYFAFLVYLFLRGDSVINVHDLENINLNSPLY